MGRFRTLLRRLRTLLWTALTLVTLVAAIMVGVGKLLMPYSVKYQPQLEEWLSTEFGQPVKVESFSGEWKAFGPRISLEGVTLLGEAGVEAEIAIQHAALDIKPLYGLLPGKPFYSFRIIGADMALLRLPDGRFELSGLGVSGRGDPVASSGGLSSLTRVGEVLLEDSSLSFDDELRGIHLQFAEVQGRLQLDGRQLATDMEASVMDEHQTRVLGDFKATLLITLSEDQRLAEAKWHVKTRELMISELAGQLPAHPLVPQTGWLNAELWGDWSQDSSQLMEGVVDLRESGLSAEAGLLELDHLNTRFRWHMHSRKVWRLDLSDLAIDAGGKEWATDHMSVERNIPGNLGLWVSSDLVHMEFPLQVTQRVMTHYNTAWPRSMPRRARGEVNGFDLVLDSRWKLFMARGQFENTDAWDWDRWPAVSGVRGTLDLLGGEGQLDLEGEQVRLDWPRNFRRQAVVDIPECKLEILWGAAWQVDARDCTIRNEDIEMYGRARFAKTEGRPAIDINMVANRANLGDLDDYWPESVMRPAVTSWLRRGLVSGEVTGGRFIMQGDMDDWPFPGKEGQLEARIDVGEVDLDYFPAWPRANRVNGIARFLGSSMDVEASVGSIGGVQVQSVSAHLENFRQPVLELEYAADASLEDLVGFIRQTPLLDNVDLDLEQYSLTGDARTTGLLMAPLRAGGDPVQIDGSLLLSGNGFTEKISGVQLHEITGEISYDREGLSGTSLDTRFRDNETRLDLIADWDAAEVFRTDLRGNFAVADVVPASLLENEPLLGLLDGSADWDINLTVKGATETGQREVWLEMVSDMAGIELLFPAPLKKPAEVAWPLRVRYPVKSERPIFSVAAENRAILQFDIENGMGEPKRASMHLGAGTADLPGIGLFSVGGAAGLFDLDQWMELIIERFRQRRGVAGLQFEAAQLAAAELLFLNRVFPNVEMGVTLEDRVLTGSFSSDMIAGTVRYSQSDDGSHSLGAEMDRLLMPEPVAGGMVMDTDPAGLPEMHFYAREFSYLGLELGETRIEAYPVQDGFHLASVEATAKDFTFQARGDWSKDENGEISDFDIVMTSESIGSLMDAMEISSILQGGQTMLHFDAWWPGPPAAFALARLSGEMDFSVIGGNIRNADAGAGRMVGLLSIAALPRRLALDFRDVFGSGFSFDQANGTITLDNGTAHTDNLVLESTAATMSIRGNSDLANREFDYTLAVRPGVGQTLPVLGAIAGGPGGAAAGLALQGLFQKSLGDATEARYSITGKWQDPNVERVTMATIPDSKPVNE
jgi:uncharacterized protein (TIGR02099 family)